jgi:dTDP-4-dehydrorhamnose 3,5-epimerase-like enzyme
MRTDHQSLIKFDEHSDHNGILHVYECGNGVPFIVKRIFTVKAKSGDFRGDHAHKKCNQLLICLSGRIKVTCNDGENSKEYLLDNAGYGLLVTSGTWAKQSYLDNDSTILVLCDRVYEKDDYIHEYEEYMRFIKKLPNTG